MYLLRVLIGLLGNLCLVLIEVRVVILDLVLPHSDKKRSVAFHPTMLFLLCVCATIFNSVDLVEDINSSIQNDRKFVHNTLAIQKRGHKTWSYAETSKRVELSAAFCVCQ